MAAWRSWRMAAASIGRGLTAGQGNPTVRPHWCARCGSGFSGGAGGEMSGAPVRTGAGHLAVMVRTRLATALSSIQYAWMRRVSGPLMARKAPLPGSRSAPVPGTVGGGFGLAGADDPGRRGGGGNCPDDTADVAGFGVLGGGDDVDAEGAAEGEDRVRRSTMPGRRASSRSSSMARSSLGC